MDGPKDVEVKSAVFVLVTTMASGVYLNIVLQHTFCLLRRDLASDLGRVHLQVKKV